MICLRDSFFILDEYEIHASTVKVGKAAFCTLSAVKKSEHRHFRIEEHRLDTSSLPAVWTALQCAWINSNTGFSTFILYLFTLHSFLSQKDFAHYSQITLMMFWVLLAHRMCFFLVALSKQITMIVHVIVVLNSIEMIPFRWIFHQILLSAHYVCLCTQVLASIDFRLMLSTA